MARVIPRSDTGTATCATELDAYESDGRGLDSPELDASEHESHAALHAIGSDGQPVFARATVHDIPALKTMIASCSPESRLRRFFRLVPSAPEGYLEQVIADRKHHHAYVVWFRGEVVGLAELHRSGPGTGDVGLIIEDKSQRRGVGTAALRFLVSRAEELGIRRLSADTHLENSRAISLFRYLGTVSSSRETDVLHMEIDLHAAENRDAVRRFCVYA